MDERPEGPPGEPRLQANAYFAVAIAVDAMDQMLDFFSRDYLLEKWSTWWRTPYRPPRTRG